MTSARPAIGNHILADLHGVKPAILRDGPALDDLLRRAADHAGAHILSSHFHSFGDGAGVTGIVLLAESHISIHTWPELGLAAIDIFMCGASDCQRALEILIRDLSPADSHVTSTRRGHGP